MILEENNFDKARKAIRELKGKIIFSSQDEEVARKVLEKEKIEVFLIRQKGRKDRQKQRDSGLDSVTAKLAKKGNVKIGIYLDEIINSSEKEKSEILSRIRQNIKLCNKEKLKMIFITSNEEDMRNIYDLKAIGLVLGMSTWMIKEL